MTPSPTLDNLLADAQLPTPPAFDTAAGLRRLAADAARLGLIPTVEVAGTRLARRQLDALCRCVLNRPTATRQLRQLAGDQPLGDKPIDPGNAMVYGCLLHLTGHPESAQFWWGIAAGAEVRTAAYCLHLHHLQRGELREARYWIDQTARQAAEDTETAPALSALTDYFRLLDRFTHYVGNAPTAAATEPLEVEVARLAADDTEAFGIVHRPDHLLADRFHDVLSCR